MRRLVSTFLRTLPHLSPAGWGSLADLLYPCPPGTPRRSLPVRTRVMTSLCCDDLFQYLVCGCGGSCTHSYTCTHSRMQNCAGVPQAQLHFCLTVIRPIVEYAAPVWHHGHHLLAKSQTDQIETIQKRALNIIYIGTRSSLDRSAEKNCLVSSSTLWKNPDPAYITCSLLPAILHFSHV